MMAAVELHRTKDRGHLPVPLRVERLEEDADNHEATMATVASKMDSMNARLLGVLVSTTGAAVALVINVLVGRH